MSLYAGLLGEEAGKKAAAESSSRQLLHACAGADDARMARGRHQDGSRGRQTEAHGEGGCCRRNKGIYMTTDTNHRSRLRHVHVYRCRKQKTVTPRRQPLRRQAGLSRLPYAVSAHATRFLSQPRHHHLLSQLHKVLNNMFQYRRPVWQAWQPYRRRWQPQRPLRPSQQLLMTRLRPRGRSTWSLQLLKSSKSHLLNVMLLVRKSCSLTIRFGTCCVHACMYVCMLACNM